MSQSNVTLMYSLKSGLGRGTSFMDKSHCPNPIVIPRNLNVSFHSVADSGELQGLVSTANTPRNRGIGLLQLWWTQG